MPAVKPVSQASDKWVRRAGQAAPDYQKGVQNPRTSWAEATVAAADAQAAGVQNAISNGSFEKGVSAAGNAKWQRKASTVGAQRFGPGVAAAKGDYESGFAPYAAVIQGVTLAPRGAKGDPRNYERVTAIGNALHDAKQGK
jgi:hypothetical protein